MEIRRELGAKGQVVIPKDIRTFLGLKRGQAVVFEVRHQEVVVKSAQDPDKFLQEFFDVPKLKKPLTLKDIKKDLDEAYDLP